MWTTLSLSRWSKASSCLNQGARKPQRRVLEAAPRQRLRALILWNGPIKVDVAVVVDQTDRMRARRQVGPVVHSLHADETDEISGDHFPAIYARRGEQVDHMTATVDLDPSVNCVRAQ